MSDDEARSASCWSRTAPTSPPRSPSWRRGWPGGGTTAPVAAGRRHRGRRPGHQRRADLRGGRLRGPRRRGRGPRRSGQRGPHREGAARRGRRTPGRTPGWWTPRSSRARWPRSSRPRRARTWRRSGGRGLGGVRVPQGMTTAENAGATVRGPSPSGAEAPSRRRQPGRPPRASPALRRIAQFSRTNSAPAPPPVHRRPVVLDGRHPGVLEDDVGDTGGRAAAARVGADAEGLGGGVRGLADDVVRVRCRRRPRTGPGPGRSRRRPNRP